MTDTTDTIAIETEIQLRVNSHWGDFAPHIDTKSFSLIVGEPVYGSEQKQIQPEEQINETSAQNPLTTPIEMDLSATGTFKATSENRLTISVTAGGLSVPIPFPAIGTVDFGITPTNETSKTSWQKTSTMQSFSQSFKLQVDPKTEVSAKLIVTPVKFSRQFTANVEIKGTLRERVLGLPGYATVGIGTLFTDYPSPNVQVISQDTIHLQISGMQRSIVGSDCRLVPSVVPL